MVLSCILIVSAQADASDHGFYTGLGYGVAFYKNKTESGYLMPSNSNQHDHSENYFELYAGYSFNKYFSLEFGTRKKSLYGRSRNLVRSSIDFC